jgi:hypothetical protein
VWVRSTSITCCRSASETRSSPRSLMGDSLAPVVGVR